MRQKKERSQSNSISSLKIFNDILMQCNNRNVLAEKLSSNVAKQNGLKRNDSK